MISVAAASRLHFGLFSVGGTAPWPTGDGQGTVPARRFGGAGLMVQEPELRLTVQPAADWSAEGPLAERALHCARRLAAGLPECSLPPQHLQITRSAPQHAGLGTGTHLALAVARAISAAAALPWTEPFALRCAALLGRGQRSALGIHGFLHGGFLVEAGKAADTAISPLLFRADFPEDWRILLVRPAETPGLHDSAERQAFSQLHALPTAPASTDALARLVLLGLMPALLERDLPAFGEALYDFNRRVGEVFAPVQGGPYAHPAAAEAVDFMRAQGVRGVGQSSWGPTLFAVVEADRADRLAQSLRDRQRLQVSITQAANTGARFSRTD